MVDRTLEVWYLIFIMKKTIILSLISLYTVSCTSVRRDDHSYSYVYQHNEKTSEDTPSIPKPKKNVEYTTYKQEYNNYKTTDTDAEYLNRTELPPYNPTPAPPAPPRPTYQPQVQPRPTSRREFNPYDNQFINSSYRVNKNMEESVPNIFGPDGYVRVESRVPNSNPPIINTFYYPATKFR